MSLATRRADDLARAVALQDHDQAAEILAGLSASALRGLALELAGRLPDREADAAEQVTRVIEAASRLFGTAAHDVLSGSRRYEDATARAVACYALHRLYRMPATYIGRQIGRDHSSVLHSCGRVGEDARLRDAARRIAVGLGWEPVAA